MSHRKHKWILIDKSNMKTLYHTDNTTRLTDKLIGSDFMFRDFRSIIIIKNETRVVPLFDFMHGVGGDTVSIHRKVQKYLEEY